jgi:hypothetical protein
VIIPDILALDFDGVCCDGLREYFEVSRRVIVRLWPGEAPGGEAFEAFCALRPVILSGWEMPVLLRAIGQGRARAEILAGWERVRDEIVGAGTPAGAELIARLRHEVDEVRREWIAADAPSWLALHAPYAAVEELRRLVAEPSRSVLVTTKEGAFARMILEHWDVPLAEVHGKEAGEHKCLNLRALIAGFTAERGRRPRLAFVGTGSRRSSTWSRTRTWTTSRSSSPRGATIRRRRARSRGRIRASASSRWSSSGGASRPGREHRPLPLPREGERAG